MLIYSKNSNKVVSVQRIILLLLSLRTYQAQHGRPNIIVFLADDLGWSDVSFHGSDQIPTPNIDRIANEGIILNNYYVQKICTPSRGALMSGKYPSRFGLQHEIPQCGQPFGLPLTIKTMPQHLSNLGYKSHIVGKWHLGFFHRNYTPTYRGFESFYGNYIGRVDLYTHAYTCSNRSLTKPTHKRPTGYDWHYDIRGDLNNVDDYGKYATDILADRAVKLIREHNQSQPLFLYVPFQAVHSTEKGDVLQAPLEEQYKFKHIYHIGRRKYAALASKMDQAVGKILDEFQKSKMMDNSIVVFSSDNGGAPQGADDNWGTNFPLKGGKGTTWEGGVRAVGAVWGSMFKKNGGKVSSNLMHIVDWLPTFYEAAGGDVSDLGHIDGVSQYEQLRGMKNESARNEVLINMDTSEGAQTYRWGDYKLIYNPLSPAFGEAADKYTSYWYPPSGEFPYSTYKFPPTKLPGQITCGPVPGKVGDEVTRCFSKVLNISKCLYNVKEDPCEFKNLIDDPDYQHIVEYIDKRLDCYRSAEHDILNLAHDAESSPKHPDYLWKPWRDDPKMSSFDRTNDKAC